MTRPLNLTSYLLYLLYLFIDKYILLFFHRQQPRFFNLFCRVLLACDQIYLNFNDLKSSFKLKAGQLKSCSHAIMGEGLKGVKYHPFLFQLIAHMQ